MRSPSQKHPPGLTLIEVSVVSLIVGLVGIGIIQLLNQQFKATGSLQDAANRAEIKRFIEQKLSCSTTLAATPCTVAGTLVDALDSAGNTVIPAAGKVIGNYTVRAECSNPLGDLRIRLAKLKPGRSISSSNPDDFYPDPLLKRTVTFSDVKSLLYDLTVSPCSGGSPIAFFEYKGSAVTPLARPNLKIMFGRAAVPAGWSVITWPSTPFTSILSVAASSEYYDMAGTPQVTGSVTATDRIRIYSDGPTNTNFMVIGE